MAIQPYPVTRDADGNWQHPDLPDWSESTPSTEMDYWAKQQGLHTKVLRIGQRIDPDVVDRWLAGETGHSDDWPEDYQQKGYFVLAVSQSEEDIFVWLARPQGGIHHEVHTAA